MIASFFGCKGTSFSLRLATWTAAVGCMMASASHADDTWILVDTERLTLSVMQGEQPVREFAAVSIGRNGTTASKIYLDHRTPLGSFKISAIRDSERYYRFIGIDYPDLEYARRALNEGVIDSAAYDAILTAHEQGREPPATTPLGGHIGIHGLGDGDRRIHEEFNWTEGCVALTNEEVDELLQWVRPRMRVVIL